MQLKKSGPLNTFVSDYLIISCGWLSVCSAGCDEEEQQADHGIRDDDDYSQDNDRLDLASLHSSDSMSVYISSLFSVAFASILHTNTTPPG